MLGDRKLIIVLGLSRGGTNHLAQRIHACEGVAGFSEGMSRMIVPSRNDARQIVRREALGAAVLKPGKPAFDTACWSFNKVNYTLVSYPEAWVEFLRRDSASTAIVLLRHPLMVHHSRVQYVQSRKRQRVRWLAVDQLAREYRELLAIAWRLEGARFVFHEQAIAGNYEAFLRHDLRLIPRDGIPSQCPACAGPLDQRARPDDGGRTWLYCEGCSRFIEGEGDYNFIRRESDTSRYREHENAYRDKYRVELNCLKEALGAAVIDFFAQGRHWETDAPATMQPLLSADADRWAGVPLNEILYPY